VNPSNEHSAPHEVGSIDWVARISRHELAALSVTLSKVQGVLGDRNSSFADLTEEIVKDAGLTSKLLKIANSPLYAVSADPVTTVSRATSLMGFDAIRNICITSRLLEATTTNPTLPDTIKQRLLKLSAIALHSAVQARALIDNSVADHVREEVFIAALLKNIGEIAFWCVDCPEALELDRRLEGAAVDDHQRVVSDMLGIDFQHLGLGLANEWGLGGLVVDALQGNHRMEPTQRVVDVACKVAEAAAAHGWSSDQLKAQAPAAAQLMRKSDAEALKRLIAAGKEAERIARDYGVGRLGAEIAKTLAHESVSVPIDTPDPAPALTVNLPNDSVQLEALKELGALMAGPANLNQIISTAMEGIHRGIGLDRTITALLSPDRKSLSTRLSLGHDNAQWGPTFRLELRSETGLLDDCVLNRRAHRVSDLEDDTSRTSAGALGKFCPQGDFMIAPIVVADRCIGVLYSDRATQQTPINQSEFASFCHFAQQMGMCITNMSKKTKP